MLIEVAHFLSILSTGLFFICFIFSFFLNSKDIFIINLVSRIYTHSFFIFLSSVNSSELNQQEISYFKIIDLNNDGFVSVEEINQSLDIIFQLIDVNKDQLISLSELDFENF